MRVIQVFAKADADGVLRLNIPAGTGGGDYHVAVVLHQNPAPPPVNGTGHKPTPEELGWPPGFFEKTFGSITDETFEAPPRGPVRPVEALD